MAASRFIMLTVTAADEIFYAETHLHVCGFRNVFASENLDKYVPQTQW